MSKAKSVFNWSLGRDTPQQKAAARLMWRARQLQRYKSVGVRGDKRHTVS